MEKIIADTEPVKPAMSPEEIQNWIMLKNQDQTRFFKIEVLDEDMAKEPNMIALMDTLSDFIWDGMKETAIQESMNNTPDLKPVS